MSLGEELIIHGLVCDYMPTHGADYLTKQALISINRGRIPRTYPIIS